MIVQKITPFLWFDGNAAEAAKFYVSVFENSKILSESPMIVTFELEGQKFIALNGGPQFKFTEAVSFLVSCETQGEVNDLWEKLSAGGEESRCGWLKDRFGLSWQIIPNLLMKLMNDKDAVKANRVMEAMLKMKKIEMQLLQDAYDNK